MGDSKNIAVIIPALNEEETIGRVIGEIPPLVTKVVVVDNGSKDSTAKEAAAAGAAVVEEPRKGYGSACLAGMAFLDSAGRDQVPSAVAFLDGDLSDDPAELEKLLLPIVDGDCDMVIGSRVKGDCEKGALTITQRFGNWLSCRLIKLIYGASYSDLGPQRALRWSSLLKLEMDDRDFGWTVQMQIRAAKHGMKVLEIPVNYRRRRGGRSKVSGTVKGILLAGTTIIWVILRESRSDLFEKLAKPRT